MTEQQPITNNTESKSPPIVLPTQRKNILISYWQRFINFIPQPAKNVLLKFYHNKKVFLPVTISFGLLFLVIVMGLLFGKPTSTNSSLVKTSPTPVVTNTSQPSSEPEDIVTVTRETLKDLKSEINALDVDQSVLQPPTIDFEIKFN